jgi:tetratricopeptide (TPR) repeat protein
VFSTHRARSARLAVLTLLALATATSACQRDPLERARRLQDEQHDFAGSLEPLREAIEDHPEDAEINYRYGIALIATGQHSLAKWSLRKAMESPEWREQAGIPLATTAVLLGGYDEAVEVASRVLEQHPDHVEALLVRADARVRTRRQYQDALADTERVLEIDPENKGAMAPKVVALLGLGRIDEAAAELDSFEGSFRDDSLGLHGSPALCAARATFAKEKNDPEQAEKRFGECLEEFPSEGMVVNEAIAFFDALGRPERSEEILQRAVAAEPDAFGYRASLVARYRATGRESEAKALLVAAAELPSPASAAVGWSALALYSIETGDFALGARAFEQARALDPTGNPEILFGYADALVVAGRHGEALDVAETMTVPAHRSLVRGRVALERGQPAKALALISEGNRLWPNNAVSRYYAAMAAEQIGDFERAVEEYRYSMRIDVNITDAYLRLARIQVAAGQIEEALVSLDFQPSGPRGRPGEEEAALLELELLAREGRPPPPPVLARIEQDRKAAAAAAIARGIAARRGPSSAVEFLRKQKDLDLGKPENADALAELIRALAAAGKTRDALARVDAGVKAHPDSAAFHALQGDARAANRADAGAVRAAYQRALEIDPADHRGLVGLAGVEEKAGASDAALALYERAARADSGDRASPQAAAKLLVALGKPQDAEARLTALLREHPYDAQAAIALAELRRARGADAGATKELARRAVKFGGGAAAQALLERVDAEKSSASAPPRAG